MTRPLRIEYAGGLYHITSRGDGREDIYLNNADREAFVHLLGDVCERFGWLCHAYCLMDNHYHLLIETPEANLSRGMRQLNGVYTQRFNRSHGRCGHVFQGRYKAIVVQKEAYLLELCRYVALNPVRAGMVNDVADWPWSSFAATAGLAKPQTWLAVDAVLNWFGNQREQSIKRYVNFVRDEMTAHKPWKEVKNQIYLGDEAFMGGMPALTADNDREINRVQRRASVKSLAAYQQQYPNRDEAMARAYLSGHYTMKEIGECFGVHYVTVSRAVRKFERGSSDRMYECKT